MNNRERLLALLAGNRPDRVPWFADMSYWYGATEAAGKLDEKYLGDGYFHMHRELDVGFYLQGYFPFEERAKGVSFESVRNGNEVVTTMKTPRGTLTEIQQYLPVSSSYGLVKHYVEDYDDLPAFQYYIENLSYTPNYDEAVRRKDIIGDNGVVVCYTPRTPFMQMITTFSGVENLIYLLMDYPEEVDELLSVMEEKYDVAAAMAVDSPAEMVMIPQNLSSEVVGSRYYEKYLRPCEKKWIEKIKNAGKYSLIHMDGTLKGLISEVAETGFDIIEAVTPAPVGDMTLEEVTNVVLEDTIIWGGVPGTMFTPMVSDDDFEKFVIEILTIMKTKPRFVLGVADQVPPDGLLSRVKAVATLIERYGKY